MSSRTGYGAQSKITADHSRTEIEEMLSRFGCDGFSYATDGRENTATIRFRARNRIIRFEIPLPVPEDFPKPARGRHEPDKAVARVTRQRWRALVLVVKAKLVAIASGVTQFESEFLGQTEVPGAGGATVGELLQQNGALPALVSGTALEQHAPPRRLVGHDRSAA